MTLKCILDLEVCLNNYGLTDLNISVGFVSTDVVQRPFSIGKVYDSKYLVCPDLNPNLN